MKELIRPCWLEIDLDNIEYNYNQMKSLVKSESKICGVIKADAYGHGAKTIAKKLIKLGSDYLAVASLNEAIELRREIKNHPILILGYTETRLYEKVIQNNLTQTIYTFNQAKKFSEKCQELEITGKVHIKIETGMNRLGFIIDENIEDTISKIYRLENLSLEGIYSHFATADSKEKTLVNKQYKLFTNLLNGLEKKKISIPIKHISNSAAIIENDMNLDMVRLGIALYGLYPSDEIDKNKVDLKQVMKFKAKISNSKHLKNSEGISYGYNYYSNKNSNIITIPVGYADGFSRLLSNKAYIKVGSKFFKVSGSICMDQLMVDIGKNQAKPKDEVELIGLNEKNSIDTIAKLLGTINYEVPCMISRRVPRVYFEKNKIQFIEDYLI